MIIIIIKEKDEKSRLLPQPLLTDRRPRSWEQIPPLQPGKIPARCRRFPRRCRCRWPCPLRGGAGQVAPREGWGAAGERRTPGCPSRPRPRRPTGLRVSTGRGKCVPRGRSGRPPRLGGAQRRGSRGTCCRPRARPSRRGSAPLPPRRIHPGGSQIRPGGMRTPGLCGLRRGRAGLLVERHNNKCVAEPARKEWG